MAGERSYRKIGERTNLPDLEEAAKARLDDADALLHAGRYASCIVMCLYALEISLKVTICRRLDLDYLPQPFEIHDSEELLILSGLSNKLRALADPNGVKPNWDSITSDFGSSKHVNEPRYRPGAAITEEQARGFLERLRDPTDGLLEWLHTQP